MAGDAGADATAGLKCWPLRLAAEPGGIAGGKLFHFHVVDNGASQSDRNRGKAAGFLSYCHRILRGNLFSGMKGMACPPW
jgi:hypothetical protein